MALADLDQLPVGLPTTPANVRWLPTTYSDARPVSYPDAAGRYPWSPGYNSGPVAPPITSPIPTQPNFNLANLFNGGNRGTNPGMVATVKSPAVAAPLNNAFATRTSNAGQETQSLKDYAAAVLGGQPQAKQFADQEINSVNQIYGTGGDSIEARLAALNRQEEAAANIAAQRAFSGVRRNINARRVGGGSSSYLDRLFAQNMYGIGAANSGAAAQRGRSDLEYLTGLRNGAVGRRANIMDILAQRNLAPVMANQQVESGALGNLGRLANLDYGNNEYEMPEEAYRRQMDFINYLSPYLYG